VAGFGSKLLENFMSPKQAAVAGASIPEFVIKDVISGSNGNVIILSEEQSDRTRSPADPMKPVYTYDFERGNILTICLKPDGSSLWGTVIKKTQKEENVKDANEKWGSFVYGLVNDRLFILWNNVDITPFTFGLVPISWKEPDGTKYVKKDAFAEKTVHGTFMYIIEPNGELTYSNRKYGLPLFNLHKGTVFEMSLNPNIFYAEEDGIILFSEMHNQGKRYKFGKLKL
jgi:hypothetical protein